MMNLKVLLIFLTTLFQFPNYTKNWQGSDIPGHCYATFDDFNGKQDFKIKLLKKEGFNFKYSTTLTKGTLRLTIKSGSKTIYEKELKGSISDEVKIENSQGGKFKFIFMAKHAKGSFDVRY